MTVRDNEQSFQKLLAQIEDLRIERDAAEKREKILTERNDRQRRSLEVYAGNLATTQRDLDRALAALREVVAATHRCTKVVAKMADVGPKSLYWALRTAVDTLAEIHP